MSNGPRVAKAGTVIPPEALVEHARRAIERYGIAEAARVVGIGREPLIRLAGGQPVQRGTIALAEPGLTRVVEELATAGADQEDGHAAR